MFCKLKHSGGSYGKRISFRLILLIVSLLFISSVQVWAHTWEVGIKAMGSAGNPVVVNVYVYTYDQASNSFIEFDNGRTSSAYFSGAGSETNNGVFDISDSNTSGAIISGCPAATILCIRIENKYYKLVYEGAGAYGDMMFYYRYGQMSLNWISSTCGYTAYGPYTWSDKTITLKNDFGLDRESCSGSIIFNSQQLNNVGYTGVSLIREAGTFPHYTSGIDGQSVNNFARKWQNWNDAVSSIGRDLTIVNNYDLTAIYAKELNVNLSNSFTGGTIKKDGVICNLPLSNLHFYDIGNYQLEALNQTVNYISYQFINWNYNGTSTTQNPLPIPNPTSHISLTAQFTGVPLFPEAVQGQDQSIRNLQISQVNYQPIELTWKEHPNPDVTKYNIYRKVKNTTSWINGELIATVPRGTTSYTDQEYMFTNSSITILLYDIRAYCDAYGTESYPAFQGPNYGTLYKASDKVDLAEFTNSLNNYPNPFNPATKITYSIKEDCYVLLQVFDVLGNKVADLINEFKPAGYYSVTFDGKELPSGIYITIIKAKNYNATRKILLIK